MEIIMITKITKSTHRIITLSLLTILSFIPFALKPQGYSQSGKPSLRPGTYSSKPPVESPIIHDQNETGDLRALTTPKLVELSNRIVLAKCSAVEVREGTGGNIFTFSNFNVLQVIKGSMPTKEFRLRLLGGRIGNIEVDHSGIPQFAAGEEVVLFLGQNNQEGYPTIFPQATFRVRTQPVTGLKIILPNPTDLPLYRAADKQPYASRMISFTHSPG